MLLNKDTLLFLIVSFACCIFVCSEKTRDQVLSEKVEQMMEWSNKRAVIRMDSVKFRNYVRTAPRNYSVIAMLTALQAQRQCVVCKPALEEFQIVANSWRYSPQYSDQLFFVLVDYDEANEVFQSLKINSAPALLHFPDKGKPKKGDTMDIHRVGFSAEILARWISERTDVNVRVFRPPNYSGTLALAFIFSLVGGLLYIKRNSLEFLYNRTTWGLIALAVIFCMISGQMWNHIRGPPFMHRNPQTGQVSYIHGSSQGQFIFETYIVIFLNVAIVVGMILLTEAGAMATDPQKKKMVAAAGLACVVIFFSLLLSVFRAKYQGYPYSFLFK